MAITKRAQSDKRDKRECKSRESLSSFDCSNQRGGAAEELIDQRHQGDDRSQ